ncbi:MAG: TIGR03620 family F420-dependent LLM class oxidoreductase [Chloroflexota bacterium]
MDNRRAQLRARLGRIGVWSFALQANSLPPVRDALASYERQGYRSVWFPESIGSKEAFAHAALLLGANERLIVGTGIANLYARDAHAMALGGRTLAEAYPGRFVLGIGVSHAPSVATRGGVYGKPIEQMRAYLDAMDAAPWVGPETDRPPVLLAALGPKMLDLAAERADGAHPYFVPVEHTRMARERLGSDPVLVTEVTAVIDDAPRARETARAFAARYLALPNYANNLLRLGYAAGDVADGGSERLINDVIAIGSASEVAARVREHLQAGADTVVVQLRAPSPADLCVEGFGALAAELGDLLA